jgi:hypothetical protein
VIDKLLLDLFCRSGKDILLEPSEQWLDKIRKGCEAELWVDENDFPKVEIEKLDPDTQLIYCKCRNRDVHEDGTNRNTGFIRHRESRN